MTPARKAAGTTALIFLAIVTWVALVVIDAETILLVTAFVVIGGYALLIAIAAAILIYRSLKEHFES